MRILGDKKEAHSSECASLLYTDNSKCTEHARDKDREDADGCNVAYHNAKERLHLELARDLDLFDEGLGLEEEADEDTGAESHDRHKHAVRREVKEVKQLHTDNLHICPCAVAERGGNTERERYAENDKAACLTSEPELVVEDGNDSLHEGYRGCERREEYHYKERRTDK